MVLDSEMRNAKEHFEKNHIKLSDCWLENCTEWFRENYSSYSQKDMLTKIYEQWLLLDLRQVELPVLPDNISTAQKMVLRGKYSLQLICLTDISKPKLVQLYKIRNSKSLEHVDTDNPTNTKRMLQLTLTDGVQEVKAIEYKYMKCLNNNLTPGMKVQIIGPVDVRRGQILLEGDCIKLLGGEVEEILITNAYENVLASALNLPINPQPSSVKDTFDNIGSQTTSDYKITNEMKNIKIGRNLDDPKSYKTSPNKPENVLKSVSLPNTRTINAKETNAATNSFFDDESSFKNKRQKLSKSPDLFDDTDFGDEFFENIDIPTECKVENTSGSLSSHKSETKNENLLDTFNDFVDDKLFEDIQVFEPECGCISIKHLTENYINKKVYGKYKIKASFKNIVEKLTVCEFMWYLKMSIEDDTGCIDVLVHNDVVAGLIGYSASEMMKLKPNVINKDKEIIDKIKTAVGNCCNKILDIIDCMMEIEYNEQIEVPMITKLFGK